jgi:hypothetical protein
MDLYANKKIKITKNALTGRDTLTLYEKHSDVKSTLKPKIVNKKFYSTKSTPDLKTKDNLKEKDDKYLTYITPLKAKKSKSEILDKIINPPNKKSFSVMDIETIEFKGKEIPCSISIKTENSLKLFIIDHNQ